jgi:rRNA maturation endonuclease Nob1
MAGLSEIDLGILALSINLKKTLVTDDYRLQNLAEKASIDWISVTTDGITEIWNWELKCIACKKIFPQPEKPNLKKADWGRCEDCGSELKLKKMK